MKIAIIIAVASIFVTASGTAATAGAQVEEGGPTTVRTYDLSFLPIQPDDNGSPGSLSFIPFQPPVSSAAPGGAEPIRLAADFIVEIIHTVIGYEEMEHNGVFIDVYPQGLLVRGPEAVHAAVRHVLAFVRSRLERRAVLDIEIFEAPDAELFEKPADAEWVRRAAADGRARRIIARTAAVRIGEVLDLQSGTETSVAWDSDPEIAQAGFAGDPTVDTLFTGIRLSVRPLIAPNGRDLLLAVFAMVSEPIDPPEPRELKFFGRVTTESASIEIPFSLALDDVKLGFASAAGVLSAESGQTALVAAAFPHHRGRAGFAVLITPQLPPAAGKVDLDGGWALAAFDFNHLLADVVLPLRFTGANRIDLPAHDLETAAWTTQGAPGRIFFVETSAVFEPLLWEESSPLRQWLDDDLRVTIAGDTVFVLSRGAPVEEINAFFENLPSASSEPVRVKITCVEADGPAVLGDAGSIMSHGRVIGGAALPLKAGGAAAVFAGMEGLMVADYDVDVANNAAAANPTMAAYVDGAQIHLSHERGATFEERGSVRARASLSVLKPPLRSRRLSEQDGLAGIIDQPVFERGFIDMRFECDGALHLLGSVTSQHDGKVQTIYVIGAAE